MKKFLIRGVSLVMALVMAISIAVLFTGCDENCLGHYEWHVSYYLGKNKNGYNMNKVFCYRVYIYHTDDDRYRVELYGSDLGYDKDEPSLAALNLEPKHYKDPDTGALTTPNCTFSGWKYFSSQFNLISSNPKDTKNLLYVPPNFSDTSKGNIICKVTMYSGKMGEKGSKAILDFYGWKGLDQIYLFSGEPYYAKFVPNSSYKG